MWFRMSYNLLHSNVFAEIMTPRGKGDRPESRMSLLIQMLCASADGAVFDSVGHVERRFAVNTNTASLVWDACLKYSVITKTQTEQFTMYDWMAKNGLVGKVDNKKVSCTQTKQEQKREKDVRRDVSNDVLERLKKVSNDVG